MASQKVCVDSLLLKQALGNLIDNAAKASEGQPGRVTVSTTATTEKTEICVTDNGSGIEADDLDSIFTPFYSSRPSGTGLGLPLAARIIDLHGGTLRADSRPGRGTTFTINLPVSALPLVEEGSILLSDGQN
jgi:signal transduction histidine kinase